MHSQRREAWLPASAALTALFVAFTLLGGSAQPARLVDVYVRAAAVLAIAVVVAWRGTSTAPRWGRLDWAVWGSLFGLLLLQLIPLPPSVWSQLSGHEHYVAVYRALGLSLPWLPISLRSDYTRDGLFFLLVPLAAYLVGGMLDARGRVMAVAAWLAAAALSMVVGLVQVVREDQHLWRFYETTNDTGALGFFANRNHMAMFMAASIPMACWLGLRASLPIRAPWRYQATAAFVAAALAATLATQSRAGAVLAVASCAASIGLFYFGRGERPSRAALWVVGLLLLVLPALFIFLHPLFTRFEQLSAGDPRTEIVPSLVQAMKDYFPFGAGVGSFASLFPQYESIDMLATSYWNQAHDDWLQILVAGGVPAALTLIVALAMAVLTVRSAQQGVHGESLGFVYMAALITMLLLVHSLVDYPLRTECLAGLLGFIWGAARRISRS